MAILRRLSIQSKLMLILVAVSLTAVLAVSISSYQTARFIAEDSAKRQLLGVRITKTNMLKALLESYRDQLTALATSPTTLEALRTFSKEINELDRRPVDSATRVKLESFYRDKLIPGVAQHSNIEADLSSLMPAERGGQILQALYVAGNPNPYEQGQLMNDAGDGGSYSAAHKRFHEMFSQVGRRLSLEDIHLIDAADMRIVYSYEKTSEFATSLATGPYSRTNLSSAVRQVLKTADRNTVIVADFELYLPSLGKPAAFLCAPIFDGATPAGAITFQLPIVNIIRLMTANYAWEKEGLGKTGEFYLVGQDLLIRSQSRFMIQDRKSALEALRRTQLPARVLNQIQKQGTVMLALAVDNASTHKALAGESGINQVRDYRNQPVLSAYGPLDFENMRWAVLAEMDLSEAFQSLTDLGKRTIAITAALAILISLLSLAVATMFTRPIRALTDAARRVTAGDLNVHVKVETQDEIRELAEAFNSMAETLKNNKAQLENTLQRNEELLLNVLPPAVAARLRDGGGDTEPQTFADVSVLHARVTGLENAPNGEGQSLAWLNQLVVSFDDAAERFHVEKLKTMGPNYLAACGLSVPRPDHQQLLVEFAQELLRITGMFSREKGIPIEIQIGIHAGPVTGGVVGRKKFIYDIWGETLNLARSMNPGSGSSIQVTEAVANRLQGQYDFDRQLDLVPKSGPPIPVFRLRAPVSSRQAAVGSA